MDSARLKIEAQDLLWSIREAEARGAPVAELYERMASAHRTLADSRLANGDDGGWVDAMAAVTALAKSRDSSGAMALLESYAVRAGESRQVLDELFSLRRWLRRRSESFNVQKANARPPQAQHTGSFGYVLTRLVPIPISGQNEVRLVRTSWQQGEVTLNLAGSGSFTISTRNATSTRLVRSSSDRG